jgi:hypothetical protein
LSIDGTRACRYDPDGFLTNPTNKTLYCSSSRGELLTVLLPGGRRTAKKINSVLIGDDGGPSPPEIPSEFSHESRRDPRGELLADENAGGIMQGISASIMADGFS